ncbi:nicotinate phosphoribosyltransferase [Desulfogranum japonicum]|uniref:nicotinate phosphoribosyltransferase n=1 Tax=Desulfogranum japonicum TaxID=231447 RepID=UPI0004288044|nr:nicotinate phosphoribosyltransferase [Desulfogranum japonicum]
MGIESPLLTDLYQLTMMQAYLDHGMQDTAAFEFFVRRLPNERNVLVAAGLEQVIEYLQELHFSSEELAYLGSTGFFHERFLEYLQGLRFTGDVDAMAEGTLFFADEPIIRITAPLPLAQLVETRIINLLQFQTMIASKALRMQLAAPEKLLVDFGLRRSHGAEAGLLAARAGYIAGLHGTATVLAGMRFDIPIYGTMAHSYIQAHQSEQDAFRNFANSHPDNVVLLIDTYDTLQGIQRVIELAPALAKQGIAVKGVRIDSGDLALLSKQVRRALDDSGLDKVKIMASNSLDEYALRQLEQQNAPIDGYGIGTRLITSSDAPYLDCAYKMVEYKGQGKRKKSASKTTWPGRKQVYRYYDEDGFMQTDTLDLDTESQSGKPLLAPVMRQGKVVEQQPELTEIRDYVSKQISTMPKDMLALDKSTAYPVCVAENLQRLAAQVDQEIV